MQDQNVNTCSSNVNVFIAQCNNTVFAKHLRIYNKLTELM